MTGSIQDIITIVVADNACSPEDASAFWARLPENVAIALVKAAPKVALAWEESGDDWILAERGTVTGWLCHLRFDAPLDEWAIYFDGIQYQGSQSLHQTKLVAAALLRANGYLLTGEVSP